MKYKICSDIELALDQSIETAPEFEMLSEKILESTRVYISATTLKRLWGYLKEDVNPRKSTLDVLARFLGYKNYSAYEQNSMLSQSDMVVSRHLADKDLQVGQHVCLTWPPNRRCVVCYDGDGNFHVIEARNTKLSVGDTFKCHLIIEHEPMYMDNLCHEGREAGAYVAGRRDGVSFYLI